MDWGVHLNEDFHITTALLDQHVESGCGGRRAFVTPTREWSYAEVLEGACRFGNALGELGVRPGERVILLLPDSIEWVFAFLGAMRLGAIPVPLNTWMPAKEYSYYLEDSGARTLVVDAELAVSLAQADAFTGLDHIVVTDSLEAGDVEILRGPSLPHVHLFSAIVDGVSSELDPPKAGPSAPAFWLYSSGTTGRPKGVVHRQESMLRSALCYADQVLGVRSDDVVFSAAKLFFAYGLGNSFYFPLVSGASTVLLPARSTPAAVYTTIEKHRPTLFFCVPTLYAALLQVPESETRGALSSVRLCVSAGEPLPAEIYRVWKERFGVEILDGIGSTEMVHIYISNRAGSVQPGSTGRLVPGYEARIVDTGGEELPPGEIGNLEMKGPTVFSEYWNRPEATQLACREGWFQTGDKYRVDEEGFYVYAGRSDDMLKVSGAWVSPFEVEAALLEHAAVVECAVVGIEDENELTKPKAFVVLGEGREACANLVSELQSFVKERLAKYKYPRWVEFVDSLPKTATGKIQRYKLRSDG